MQHGPRLVSNEPIKSVKSTAEKKKNGWATFNLSLRDKKSAL